MKFKLKRKPSSTETVYLYCFQKDNGIPSTYKLSKPALAKAKTQIDKGLEIILLTQDLKEVLLLATSRKTDTQSWHEYLRRKGHEVLERLKSEKIPSIQIESKDWNSDEYSAFLEGMVLSGYEFNKYKSGNRREDALEIIISKSQLKDEEIDRLVTLTKAVGIARDLVNEPVVYLTAERLSQTIDEVGKEFGFETKVFNKKKIESLKMGGLLAINFGSELPPTFNILEYKPKNAVNKKPIVLVGKGVVYDTGGLSLKPTPNSMDMMKSDMAGAAAVIGAFAAISGNRLPVHLVGLIPATDNRPGKNAITPGDVITISDGTTVEILNTDAEGRIILADALHYAKKYNPELVIDLATLTGSAARAIGKEAAVCMGIAPPHDKELLVRSGFAVHERLVEFPLWEEYAKQIESDIADIKNLGGDEAGAITAGKFLQHFTDYPWVHIDIAGTAFIKGADSYRGKNGTGYGVRLLYHFISSKIKTHGTGKNKP